MTTEQPVTALSTEAGRAVQERRERVRDAWTDKELDTVLAAIEAETVADYRASLAAEVREYLQHRVEGRGFTEGSMAGVLALIEDKPILRDTEYEPPTMKDRARARLHRP